MKSAVRALKTPTDSIKKLEKISNQFKGANNVKVGLPKGSNDYPDGTSVIMVGAVHEFGSAIRNIPQRSYLRTAINENRKKYKKLMKQLALQILSGKITTRKALSIIGLEAQNDVVNKITDIKEPPLKYRDGNPLVDTSHLRQTITHVVDK